MKKLDLHGKSHDSVETEVINFIYKHNPPVEIITGDSKRMRDLVTQVAARHGFATHFKNWTNQGSLIIMEKQFCDTCYCSPCECFWGIH
jgi:hypothetical protein